MRCRVPEGDRLTVTTVLRPVASVGCEAEIMQPEWVEPTPGSSEMQSSDSHIDRIQVAG
jgi:hypothetical protein